MLRLLSKVMLLTFPLESIFCLDFLLEICEHAQYSPSNTKATPIRHRSLKPRPLDTGPVLRLCRNGLFDFTAKNLFGSVSSKLTLLYVCLKESCGYRLVISIDSAAVGFLFLGNANKLVHYPSGQTLHL